MVNLISTSPLEAKVVTGQTVYQSRVIDIEVVSDYGLVRLQLFSRGSDLTETLSEKLNFILPEKGCVQSSDDNTIFWSAPGEWIVATNRDTEEKLAGNLSNKLVKSSSAITVITDSRIVLRLYGPQARQLLSKGSAVDFHHSAFKMGDCVTTKFAQIPMMIAQLNEDEEFLLLTDRSFSVYLHDWLIDAAEEFED